MISAELQQAVTVKFRTLSQVFDERSRRLWAATEASALGFGGVSAVSRATGLAISTIRAGLKEIQQGTILAPPTRNRRPGAGRKPVTDSQPNLVPRLLELVNSTTRGDPQSPLQWTCKSTRVLTEELRKEGYSVGHSTIATLLEQQGYHLQVNRKTLEGTSHPDRNAQFEHIAAQVQNFQADGQPVISVDTKKKELVGNFKNSGQEWHPTGHPPLVRVHDFPSQATTKAIPYGVLDLSHNQGWVSVGIDHDTPDFAVSTIRRWWRQMGIHSHPRARKLLITADAGGSNAPRTRQWKVALQRLADETGLEIHVCHFPPGTSKWNKIEHQLFCHITRNWRGRPLTSLAVLVNLIGHTTTTSGLKVRAELDRHSYPKGIKATPEEWAQVHLNREDFHGEWNYSIVPK